MIFLQFVLVLVSAPMKVDLEGTPIILSVGILYTRLVFFFVEEASLT